MTNLTKKDEALRWVISEFAIAKKDRRVTQSDLGNALGISQPQVSELLKGNRDLKTHEMPLLENFFGSKFTFKSGDRGNDSLTEDVNIELATNELKVIGQVEAGAFRDIMLFQEGGLEDTPTINVRRDPAYGTMRQYALKVVGDSMDLEYPDGSFVTCVSWADTGLNLQPGYILHVERHNGSLIENTLKCFAIRDGKQWLEPMSSNPKHKPIEVNGGEETVIQIKGLVIGGYSPRTYI